MFNTEINIVVSVQIELYAEYYYYASANARAIKQNMLLGERALQRQREGKLQSSNT